MGDAANDVHDAMDRQDGHGDLVSEGDPVDNLQLGQVVLDHEGVQWIFTGWAKTSTGRSAFFVRSMEGQRLVEGTLWHYTASFKPTLYKKFPSLDPEFWNK